jgi:uncharacterized protein (TIGR00255 family)
MIYSMTGFGKAIATINNCTYEIEVKSLNNRFVEVSLKLPSNLYSREYEIREALRKKIRRGKLLLVVNLQKQQENASALTIDEEKVHALLEQLKELKKKFGIKGQLEIADLLNVKEMFSQDSESLSDEDFELFKGALNESLDNLLHMKMLEGKELAADLESRLDKILSYLALIEKDFKENLKIYFEKTKERIQELVADVAKYNDRMEIELALLADKSDITEECVRLKSHIKYFKEALSNGDDVGRKLNFLCQELHREANTISSKSYGNEITYNSLLIKEEIERIREQVQNIE